MFLNILRRSLILFALGLSLNTGPHHYGDLTSLRILGVLQRFGITYFIVATIHMFFAKRYSPDQNQCYSPFLDIRDYWPEWIFHLAILALHVVLTFTLHVPGCPTGYLGPGGISEDGQYFNCTGGAAGYIDRTVLSSEHMYQHPTSMRLYFNTIPYDPEGILGILTTVFLCFLGLQAGKILNIYYDWKPKMIGLAVWGILVGAIGTLLCKGTQNEGWIPINKNLWSVSFILCLGGMAFIALMLCYFTIDVKGWWTGAPFFYAGMNPIVLYVCHEVFREYFPVTWVVPKNHAARLAMDLWGTIFWVIVAVYLHYKKIFLSI